MINFDHLPLHTDILKALNELSINYVFQPIFHADGKTVFAWEALMRPTEMTVTDLIADYAKKEQLHILEVATFFGAMQAYFQFFPFRLHEACRSRCIPGLFRRKDPRKNDH